MSNAGDKLCDDAGFTLEQVTDKRAAVKFGHCKDLAAFLLAAPSVPTEDSLKLTELAHRLWTKAQCLRAPLAGNLTGCDVQHLTNNNE